MVVHEREPFNAEPPRSALADRETTAADTFYSRNHGPIPEIDPVGWRLEVDGLVGRARRLSLDDLKDGFEHQEVVATMQCAGNRRAGLIEVRDIPGEDPWGPGATSTARWAGVSLADVLRAAAIRPEAAHVGFEAPDVSQLADPPQTYGASIARAKALAPETLLAWAMNGAPLPRVHGGPVRVVVPGFIGARSVKWVRRVTALAEPSDNYFQATAYRLLPADADPSAAGPGDGLSLGAIALNSDILSPDDGARVEAGPLRVSGYAFAGDDRDVARVDVSIDGGAHWSQAELERRLSPWAWRHWHIGLEVPAGPVEIVARAWDSTAAAQPEQARHLWNPKGYVNNSWARIRVTAW
jgi:sulfite oxidase